MRSARRGGATSLVEVTHVSGHGVWVLVEERELFMPFEQFPWFRTASIGGVLNVQLAGPGHLYWPDLDVDLAVESIEQPERFPLVSQVRPGNLPQPPASTRRRKKALRKGRARGGGAGR
ncbi:MAG: DUF2442 domain-containing protein [Planctomycetes bacterium]|nr:DUF2442 domain-containing protein [Planctomycetota bacterium]